MNQHLAYLIALYAAIRMSRQSVPPKVRTVLIIQNMKLGDMVCTTPMFTAIKKHLPHVRVVVMGNSINRELLVGHPHVDEYVSTKMSIATITAVNADVCIFPGPNPVGIMYALRSSVPCIIAPRVVGGMCPQNTLWYRLLSRFIRTESHSMGTYAPGEYLKLLAPLGIKEGDTAKSLAVNSLIKESIAQSLKQHGTVIGIAPSAGNKIKQWPAKRFAEVADALIEQYGVHVALVGGPADTEEAEEMLAAMKHSDSVTSYVGTINIETLKALISNLKLFIASDTGPIYIAEALGLPTVVLVGPVDEREQPPNAPPGHVVVLPRNRQGPYLHVLNARIHDTDLVQAEVLRTEAEDVLNAARGILENV